MSAQRGGFRSALSSLKKRRDATKGLGRTEMEVTFFAGGSSIEVVGESFYQDNLRRVVAKLGREVPAVLTPEPNNKYDRNAVGVFVGGLKVGHLGKGDAAVYQQPLLQLMRTEGKPIAVQGRIKGGDPGRPTLGIWLYLDPSDFGIAPRRGSTSGSVSTGASDGGSAWLSRLPEDRIRAIAELRKLLSRETDACQRHYMFNTLEDHLYASREAFTSALAEFEDACVAHHSEIATIRAALEKEFGGIPMLPTYRQMSIMKQKAGLHAEALRWAELGLAVYGDQALQEDSVADLKKRVAKLQGKVTER